MPTLDGVAFIDPRRSTIDIIQALGRAIRKAPDKKVGTIVIPVFVDEDADPEEALDDSAFKHVWDVLKALRAHDEQLADELDDLRRRLGALRAPPGRPGKIKLDVPSATVGIEFARAFDVRLVERSTASWEFWFGLLERFVEREGHAEVPGYWREEGYELFSWVNSQRVKFKRGQLEHVKCERLEALPRWTWGVREATWERGFTHLERFMEREGHARVPHAWREDGYRLGQWVENRRADFAKGELDNARRKRLDALPEWTWESLEATWKKGFSHLESYVEREGHARVPQKHRERGFALGVWVNTQRANFRKGRLDETRRKRLEALRLWSWDTREDAWERGFTLLQRFVEREGHSRVARSFRPSGYNLGEWVGTQRLKYRAGNLDPSHRARLEALPDWTWYPHEAGWEGNFAHLQTFVAREGHARVPDAHREADGYRLGKWVGKQRSAYRDGRLDSERRARLEAPTGLDLGRTQGRRTRPRLAGLTSHADRPSDPTRRHPASPHTRSHGPLRHGHRAGIGGYCVGDVARETSPRH